MRWSSPLLRSPRAVEADGVDAGAAAHYGDPLREQKTLLAGDGFVDLSHREVVRIGGTDRLGWLHSLTTQDLAGLAPGQWVTTLVLSPHGHVEHAMSGYDDGAAFWAHVGPGDAAPLVAWLDSMRFMMRVEVHDVTEEWAVIACGPESVRLVNRAELEASVTGSLCGLWAFEALRIARGEPRLHLDTDPRTIPNEVGWIGPAVHLDKGCYRGQETVARVHNLGRPPRRLVLLHLDGGAEALPRTGDMVAVDGARVGFVTSAVRHYELGPIALAMVKRTTPDDVELTAGGVGAKIG